MRGGGIRTVKVCLNPIFVFLFLVLFLPITSQAYLELQIRADTSDPSEYCIGTLYAWTIDWTEVYAHPDVQYYYNYSTDDPFFGGIPIELRSIKDNDVVLAILNNFYVSVKADPVIEIGFDVETLVDSTITLNADISNILTFDEIVNPELQAQADISAVSGTLTGGFNGYAYRAYYNGSTAFADLINTPITGPASDSSGLVQVSGPVTSIHGEWRFTLSAGGTASGVASYIAETPEPTSLVLLALGGLFLHKKRRL